MARLEKLILNAQRKIERDAKAQKEARRRLIQWKDLALQSPTN